MFFALAYQAIYKDRRAKKMIWISCFIAIILECYYRTMSGKHFPADVLVGALVGSAIAYWVLKIHQSIQLSAT